MNNQHINFAIRWRWMCQTGAVDLTGNQHGGYGLWSFQEVHVPPLEGLTVVGLQVTAQEKSEKSTWKSDFVLKPNFLQQNQHTENRPTVCLLPWTQLNEVCNHVQVIINTSLCYCWQLKARVSHWHHSGDGSCCIRAEKEELINWTCCDTVVLQTTVFLLSARLSRENISGLIWTGQGALVTVRMVQSEYSLLPHVVVLPEFIENEAWFICQPLNCDAAKMQKQERGRKLCNR